MSVVINGLLTNGLITKGYVSFFDGNSNLEEVSLQIENFVFTTDKNTTLTGIYAKDEDISGWLYDQRRLEDWNSNSTRYNTFLGGHSYGLKDATKKEYWQSGTISGCHYKHLTEFPVLNTLTWTPVVSTGGYSFFWDRRTLFSDYSACYRVSEVSTEGLPQHSLHKAALTNTIDIGIYTRHSGINLFKFIDFVLVEEFTGKLSTSNNERVSTLDDNGNIILDNIEPRKNEYIIRDNKVILNRDVSIVVGNPEPSFDVQSALVVTVEETWENKGAASSNNRKLYTKYFPIEPGSVRLVTSNSIELTEWEEVENLYFSSAEDKHFAVDYDLGIIQLGGFSAPDLVLMEDVSSTDTVITVYPEPEILAQYPPIGIIHIEDEQILYFNKTSTGFEDCIRGYNSTIPQAHNQGSVVKDTQHGFASTDTCFISYKAVPRIEYEVTTYDSRTANSTYWLDIQPKHNIISNSILQIASYERNLAAIELSIDAPHLGGDLYAPLYYGTDVARLTATALDKEGNTVEDIQLTISLVSGSGFLNGNSKSITGYTNSLGELYAYYNSPYDRDSIELKVKTVSHENGNTLFEVNNLISVINPEDIWVYQILKHDKTLGSAGLEATITDISTDGYEIELNRLLDVDDYINGWIYATGTDLVRRYRTITYAYQSTNSSGLPVTILRLSSALPTGLYLNQLAYVYKFDEAVWDSTILNGSRVILYEWDSTAIHPTTQEPGAYTPVHPDTVSGNVLTFKNKLLPIPDPVAPSNNLGGYSIVAPSKATFVATGVDPLTGNTIVSNQVVVELFLLESLLGVIYQDALPIPHGWTLPVEEFNVGSGLGGANFITINPSASNINSLTITGAL